MRLAEGDGTSSGLSGSVIHKIKTIKCTLSQFLVLDSFSHVIQDAVERHAQITFEGSKLLQLLILDYIERGVELPRIDGKFIQQIYRAVSRLKSHRSHPIRSSSSEVNDVLDRIYIGARPTGLLWASRE